MSGPRAIRLELSAVIMALAEGRRGLEPVVATTRAAGPRDLPTAAFDPDRHRTLELALRDWVAESAGVTLGYVEQLYTFGDRARAALGADAAAPLAPHVVSIGYLALARPQEAAGPAIGWTPWRRHFPWEDARDVPPAGQARAEAGDAPAADAPAGDAPQATAGATGRPAMVEAVIAPALAAWIAEAPARRRPRAAACFGLDGAPWDPALALERYELLYSARLVAEAWRDRGLPTPTGLPRLGAALPLDHRRILATGVGRLRGKLAWKPVLFELTAPEFTLYELQRAAEAVLGQTLHKQNFRRQVERSGLVEPTGGRTARQGGRPAAEYRYAPAATSERRAASGRSRRG